MEGDHATTASPAPDIAAELSARHTQGFKHVPFNDLGAMERAVTAQTAAIMIEVPLFPLPASAVRARARARAYMAACY